MNLTLVASTNKQTYSEGTESRRLFSSKVSQGPVDLHGIDADSITVTRWLQHNSNILVCSQNFSEFVIGLGSWNTACGCAKGNRSVNRTPLKEEHTVLGAHVPPPAMRLFWRGRAVSAEQGKASTDSLQTLSTLPSPQCALVYWIHNYNINYLSVMT